MKQKKTKLIDYDIYDMTESTTKSLCNRTKKNENEMMKKEETD